jgi:hypothetical protein
MTLYLQMDGVDDWLQAPSVTFTDIYLDMSVEHKTGVAQMYVDVRPGIGFTFSLRNASNTDQHDGFTAYLDGVLKSNGTAYVPTNQRCLLRLNRGAGTSSPVFFANNGKSAQFTKGKIYDVKFYNSTTLVAHYDMSTGTVQDQSGNGNHATLTGGTWLDDGTGGTPTGTDGSITFDAKVIQYQDSLTSFDTKQAQYQDALASFDTRIQYYQDSSFLADTTQAFYEVGEVGSKAYDVRLVLYDDNLKRYDAKSAYYLDTSGLFDVLVVFKDSTYRKTIVISATIPTSLQLDFDLPTDIRETFGITQALDLSFEL